MLLQNKFFVPSDGAENFNLNSNCFDGRKNIKFNVRDVLLVLPKELSNKIKR